MGHQAAAVRVVGLHIENLKRVRVVDIHPPAGAFTLGGDNGAGKSTTIDAVAYAIGGARIFSDLQVVRIGETHAEVTVDIGEYLITRTWAVKDGVTTKLVVTDANGIPERRQQELLDSLIGDIAFDPLQFASMPAKDQRARLLKLVELPFDLDEIDGRREAVFNRRTLANRDVKRAEAVLAGMRRPTPTTGTVPLLGEALEALTSASTRKQANDEVRRRYDAAEDAVADAQLARDKAAEALAAADRALNDRMAELVVASDAVGSLPPDPDVEALAAAVATAERAKDESRAVAAYDERAAEVTEARDAAAELSEQLTAIDAEKLAGLQSAKMPIDGLAISDDGVLFNGLPFTQASGAERLRVSMAIGMAANPKLRVLLIRDASLLDEHSMQIVSGMATDHDFQVWLEVVGDANGKATIVIEDGVIRSAP